MPVLRRLRHELLVQEYIRNGGNAAAAYRTAARQYRFSGRWANGLPRNPKRCNEPRAASHCATRILAYPEVQARLEELQTEMAKRADITIDKILSDYQQALNLAKEQGRPDSIVNAATAQAKLVGLMRERSEIGHPGDFERMENISDVLEAVAKEAGPEAALALARAMGIETQAPEQAVDLGSIEPPTDAVN